MKSELNTKPRETVSRRDFLKRSAAVSALASAQMALPSWMPRLGFSQRSGAGDTLIAIFLRGGADGLNIIVPHGESAYYDLRPTLAIARPDDTSKDQRALDLDGFFGLNPAMSPLLPIFNSKHMTAIHGTGSPDPTRSHFVAMDYMERGTPGSQNLNSGWLARHLTALQTGNDSPVRAVGWGTALQASLRGAANTAALQSIIDYHLQGRADTAAAMLATLNKLYAADDVVLGAVAQETHDSLDLISKINIASYQAANGAAYNMDSPFSLALMQTAALIKADVGLEVAALDLGGWDTHRDEEPELTGNLTSLSEGLAAFYADMGEAMNHTTVVIMSEFGRRANENTSKGTDHGHGNMMLVMGGNVSEKPVIANWSGLHPDQLDNGDVKITIDYRDVLAEILTTRINNPDMGAVFPDFKPTPRGVVKKG